MIARPLVNGDWTPIHSLDQMIRGKEAVGQIVDLRLRFYYGDWWEDRTLGFRIPEFLTKNVRSGEVSLLANYIASYVSDTEGVRGVTDVQVEKTGHNLYVGLAAKTNEGKNITVEVDLSGIL